MSFFGSLFGNKAAGSGQSTVKSQISQVEERLKSRIVSFQDRTKLRYILIFPVMHKVAAKLYVDDFGPDVALRTYQSLVNSLTSDGTIREDQFKSFGWPEIPADAATHVQEFDADLRRLTRELIGQGFLKESIANALVNVALQSSARMDGLLSAGFLITILKELRAGVYSPAPEVRPEPPADADEATKVLFIKMRDIAYMFQEHSGLEWQRLLPGMQKVCAVCCIRYRGRDGALVLFRDQVQRLMPLLAQCPKNPPQDLSLTPLHIENMSKFEGALQQFADSMVESADVHPVYVAEALARLIIELTTKYYDLVYLSNILFACCTDIERGKFNAIRKTH
ncbi:hypothetical protein SAMN05443247_00458 [Bradyrhizobium erythrophlei]|jgi:hypothetical protein|nr:hypothetical protein SAMN05443247_00458 [Bradyrhizobium erythrophlei]